MGQACSRCNEFLNVGDKNYCQQCTRELLEELDAIPRSELPRLPEVLKDFKGDAMAITKSGRSFVHDDGFPLIEVPSHEIAEFLAALLNAAYPEGQG